jgi:tetratricopeptide (TPR) repeat protein
MLLLFYLCALISKAMAVTLPFVLLLMDYWPLGRFVPGGGNGIPPGRLSARGLSAAGLVLEKLPLMAASAMAAVVTFIVHDKAKAVYSLDTVPISLRIYNALYSYAAYAGKAFWPAGLSITCHMSPVTPWKALLAAVLLAGVTISVLRRAGRAAAAAPVVLSALLVLALGAASWKQLHYWPNSVTLFGRAVELNADNPVAFVCLGQAAEKNGQTDRALGYYSEAVRLMPSLPAAQRNLGAILLKTGKTDGRYRICCNP